MTDTPDEKPTAIDDESAKTLAEAQPPATVAESTTEAEPPATESESTESESTTEADPPVFIASEGLGDEPADAPAEELSDDGSAPVAATPPEPKGTDGARLVAFAVLPALALILALAAGVLKFIGNESNDMVRARIESVEVAKDSTVALLSYRPDNVEQQLRDARNLLTGGFKDYYTDFTTNVVIPGAEQKQISAVATVPKAASVSADSKKAVVLVFVNQTVVVGGGAPSDDASSLRLELEKIDGKWLISKFDPV